MLEIAEVLKRNNLKTRSYRKLGKVIVVDTNIGKKVIKQKSNNDIYTYLESRNFTYFPNVIEDDKYEILDYEEEIETPNDQKMLDMVRLIALLHNKTTYYKEVVEDDYKKIYEDINNNIDYLNSYYTDIITIIESKEYMSPSEYLLARGISKIFNSLNYSKYEINKWYEIVKEKRKQRYVVLHNNLDLSHFIRNKGAYLISWEKSKIDIPIFDFYKLYKKNCLDYDFSSLLKEYEKDYPLLNEERKLLFILISLPDKIEFDYTEYEMCKKISKLLDYLYKTDNLISPYYSENAKSDE